MRRADAIDAAKAACDADAIAVAQDILDRCDIKLCVLCLLHATAVFCTFRDKRLSVCYSCLSRRIFGHITSTGQFWVKDYRRRKHYEDPTQEPLIEVSTAGVENRTKEECNGT